MLACLMLAILIPNLLVMVNFMLSQLFKHSREKPSAFECGFDATLPSRLPFSLRFFLITVIFLIFDVEITLILPTPMIMTSDPSNYTNLLMAVFIVILLMGLAFEWKNGALEWKL